MIQVERVKRVLSTQHQARVEIESIIDGQDFSESLTRARFEEVCRCVSPIRSVRIVSLDLSPLERPLWSQMFG